MKPIQFSFETTLPLRSEQIAEQILDVTQWSSFTGCWPIPGIKHAAYEVRTPQVIGSRIRVTNRDGSTHVEEIVEWEPSRRLRFYMSEFVAPLSRLTTGFDEIWEFSPADDGTRVTRTMQLHPKSTLARLPLRLIAWLLKRAIVSHLKMMRIASH